MPSEIITTEDKANLHPLASWRSREPPTSILIICAAMKKIVIKLSIACVKCKRYVMKAVANVEGLVEVTVDAEKGLLTLIGDVDPVIAVKKLRKIKKGVTIDSVAPYKKEEPKPKPPEPKPKPPEPKEPEPCKPLPSCCNTCRPMAIGFLTYDEPAFCTIL